MVALLRRCRMAAALSLEPLLALVAAVARDLRRDFLPFLPRLAASLTTLVDEGASRRSSIPPATRNLSVLQVNI